jgi:hypothetical protein
MDSLRGGTHRLPLRQLPVLVCAVAIALSFALPGVSAARVWTVPVDAPTIAAGIDSAAVGDTVLVQAGVYPEWDLSMKSGITLAGETGDPSDVVLYGMLSSHIMDCMDLAVETVIRGISFRSGYQAEADGGAVTLINSSFEIVDCEFTASTAQNGGAVLVTGTSSPHFIGCAFSGNTALGHGGGVDVTLGATPSFVNCSFELNTGGDGGAVSCSDASEPDFVECTFYRNDATNLRGGAIYAEGGAHPALHSCVLRENSATSTGGAVGCAEGSISLESCTLYGNSATSGSGLSLFSSSEATIQQTIIARGVGGSAVYCLSLSSASVECSDIFGNAGGDYTGCIASYEGVDGNISEDPLFCAPGQGDFGLHPASPCLGAGACGQIGVLGLGCPPRRWVVPDDAPTIAAAIDSAARYDTVFVAPGVYYERQIQMKSGLSLIGSTGDGGVTIDAENYLGVFTCSDLDSTTVMRNLTISGADVIGTGGGMLMSDSYVKIFDCTFTNNAATSGASIAMTSSAPRFERCVFELGAAMTSAGAAYIQGSSPTFVDCSFLYNGTAESGVGGAVSCYSESDPLFRGCSFLGNACGADGGAIYAHSSQVSLTGCVLGHNLAGNVGGGFAAVGSEVLLDSCTLSDNAAWDASAASLAGSSGATFTGSIVSFGTTEPGTGRVPVTCSETTVIALECTDVYGNDGGDYVDCLDGADGQSGNFSADPLFCDREGNGYTVRIGSPCLDASGCGRVGALGAGCGFKWYVPSEVPTIAAALDSAAYADTVVVACGTYYESNLVMKPGVTLKSETGSYDCATIDKGFSMTPAFDCSGADENSLIEGFTIRGTSEQSAAGLYAGLGSAFIVRDCRFAALGANGAVQLDASDGVFQSCAFDSCQSTWDGGAVVVSGGSPAFEQCSFWRNGASGSGGAMFVGEGSGPANVSVVGCTFSENVADGQFGGSASDISVASDMKSRAPASVDVYNTIFAFGVGSSATECLGSGSVTLHCCDVYGNSGGDYVDCLDGQEGENGNISEDPLFCGQNNPDQPLSLQGNSACAEANQPICGRIGAFDTGCDSFVDWDGGGDGSSWEDPDNWHPDQVPGAGDHARILGQGDFTVYVNSTDTVRALELGPITGDFTLDIQSGVLGVSETCLNYETIVVRAGAALDAPNAGRGSVITNEAGATFVLNDGDLTGNGLFDNRGYFLKTGVLRSSVYLSLTNEAASRGESGFVDVVGGTLDVSGDCQNLGRARINTGAATMVSEHFIGTRPRAGAGTLLNAGALTVAAGGRLLVLGGTSVVSSGTLETTGLVDVRGQASFTNEGTLTVKPGGDFLARGPVLNQSGAGFVNMGRTSIVVGGVITNRGYFDHQENAILRGGGTFDTSLGLASIRGVIEPGASPGTLDYVGDFVQTPSSKIRLDIAGHTPGTEFDQLSITGSATFGGAVELRFAPGFVPAPGDSFPVIVQTLPDRADGGIRDTDFDCFAGLDVDTLHMLPFQRPLKLVFRAVAGSSGDAPPLAGDDAAAVTGYGEISIDVLANDVDQDSDPLSVLDVFSDEAVGEAYIEEGSGSIGYFALPGFAGVDSFRYVVGDCVSGVDTARVWVTVTAPPRSWHVPDEAPTIAAGIDSAAAGDTVIVACGTYYESGIVLKPGVVLTSETGDPDCVTIVGSGRAGAVLTCEGAGEPVVLRGLTVTGGNADEYGGGLFAASSQLTVESCNFVANSAGSGGGGVALFACPGARFTDCRFSANTGSVSGGVCTVAGSAAFERCVFDANEGEVGGAAWFRNHSTVQLIRCTVAENFALQAQIAVTDTVGVLISRSIVASSGEAAVYCAYGGEVAASCSDVYGNDGGDWSGCLVGQGEIRGNFSLDPGFCPTDPASYYLQLGSPCAEAPGCGLVGALPAGCAQEPDIGVNPPGLVVTMPAGESRCDTLVVSNGGDVALAWFLREDEHAGSSRAGRVHVADRAARRGVEPRQASPPKGVRDDRSGLAQARGSGGPDAFGYHWTDSDEPGGPVFSWFDIADVGTPLALGDDASAVVELPFSFPFYGASYDEVRVGSNGYLTFGASGDDYGNDPIPSTQEPNALVAPFWTDLNPPAGGQILWFYDAPTERFVVEYEGIHDLWGVGIYTFQVVLTPEGAIGFRYLNVDGAVDHATVGIEDATGSDGLEVVWNAAYVHDSLAVAFGDYAAWLTERPANGSLAAGAAETLVVCLDPGEMPGGAYSADIVFESNDPDQPELRVPVTLMVETPPHIATSPQGFGMTVMGGDAVCDTLWVANEGTTALEWFIGNDETRAPEIGAPPNGRSAGGVDAGGYWWVDSDQPGGPEYAWRDISGPGVPLALGDDESATVELPFAFPFYDGEKDSVRVSSNGYLTFGTAGSESLNVAIPDTLPPNDLVAPFWDDLDPGQGGHIYRYYNPSSGEFIVEYDAVPRAGGGQNTFEVVLRADGSILFEYQHMETEDGYTVGIEDATGGTGLEVAQGQGYAHDGLAVSITRSCPWLVAAPRSGVTDGLATVPVTVCVDLGVLPLGSHECALIVFSNDPDDPTVVIPVVVDVVDTGVDEGGGGRYALFGNFPNPFNPTTEIRYELPAPASVTLEVYTLSGRLVRSLLADARQDGGKYAVVWDGRDGKGRAAASGVYFYRLVADGRALTKKMVLLK